MCDCRNELHSSQVENDVYCVKYYHNFTVLGSMFEKIWVYTYFFITVRFVIIFIGTPKVILIGVVLKITHIIKTYIFAQ